MDSASCNRFGATDNAEILLFDGDKQKEKFMRRAVKKCSACSWHLGHDILKNALRNCYYVKRHEAGFEAQNKYLSSAD